MRHDDPYEGAWTDAAKLTFRQQYVTRREQLTIFGDTAEEALTNYRADFRSRWFVNCWHINVDESAAMWKLYGSTAGLAVVSSVAALKRSLKKYSRPVFIGRVQYQNVDAVRSDDLTEACFRKRPSFAHERELRIAVEDEPGYEGLKVPVNLGELIGRVLISPHADHWLTDVVQYELRQHGLGHIRTKRSALIDRTLR